MRSELDSAAQVVEPSAKTGPSTSAAAVATGTAPLAGNASRPPGALAVGAAAPQGADAPDSDESLMAAYQAGNTRAFATLLERHRRAMFNFLYRSVGDATQAEDLLQEVFLRVVRGAEGYHRQAKFTTWLYTIARNLCVDAQRRGKFRKTASLDAPVGGGDPQDKSPLVDHVADPQLGTERQAISRELRVRIEDAIARLPEEQREVFLMREVAGMAFKEIADVVGCPENTVKSRMRYALERLREHLDEYRDLAQAAG